MPGAIVVLCTVPADFDALGLASELVERSLAACVQIGPGVTSVYRWQGALEQSEEKILLIKSRSELFGALENAIKARHPYEVPEIVALEVSAGHAPYLDWLAASTLA
jgi:periplasmic divalent cation tolerance protein